MMQFSSNANTTTDRSLTCAGQHRKPVSDIPFDLCVYKCLFGENVFVMNKRASKGPRPGD